MGYLFQISATIHSNKYSSNDDDNNTCQSGHHCLIRRSGENL